MLVSVALLVSLAAAQNQVTLTIDSTRNGPSCPATAFVPRGAYDMASTGRWRLDPNFPWRTDFLVNGAGQTVGSTVRICSSGQTFRAWIRDGCGLLYNNAGSIQITFTPVPDPPTPTVHPATGYRPGNLTVDFGVDLSGAPFMQPILNGAKPRTDAFCFWSTGILPIGFPVPNLSPIAVGTSCVWYLTIPTFSSSYQHTSLAGRAIFTPVRYPCNPPPGTVLFLHAYNGFPSVDAGCSEVLAVTF